jgi:hypothetical protein
VSNLSQCDRGDSEYRIAWITWTQSGRGVVGDSIVMVVSLLVWWFRVGIVDGGFGWELSSLLV